MRNLPANIVDRAQAEAIRLEQRLDEAQQASSAGDVPATEAALSAYSTIVVEAAKGSQGDPTATAAIEVTVTRHVVILTLMVDSVPAQARASAVQALSSSTMALDDLDGAAPQGSDGPGASGGPHPVGGIDGVNDRHRPARRRRSGCQSARGQGPGRRVQAACRSGQYRQIRELGRRTEAVKAAEGRRWRRGGRTRPQRPARSPIADAA